MPDRFYHPELRRDSTVELTGSEAHHLLHVLRAKNGQQVELFDGAGKVAAATITGLTRKAVHLQVGTVVEVPQPKCRVTLATAIPKGDRSRWLVEKATELGVNRFLPLKTERSVVSPGDGKREKLEQTVIAAAKQSRSSWLMVLDSQITWDSLWAAPSSERMVLVAHPGGKPLREVVLNEESGSVTLCVGPEGGFTDDETQLARDHQAVLVSLGESILRTETAGVALASWVRFQLAHQG